MKHFGVRKPGHYHLTQVALAAQFYCRYLDRCAGIQARMQCDKGIWS